MVTAESTRSLLFSNALTAILALVLHWPVEMLLWPYWVQSVIIGWFSRQRMLALRDFSTEGFTSNGNPVPETKASLKSTANFFTLHYGFFHFVYLVFLLQKKTELSAWDWLGFAVTAGAFLMSHRASYRQNLEADARGRPNLGTLMFLPYARVIPMHLTIILGASVTSDSPLVVLLFSALKTGADMVMHYVNHRVLQGGTLAATPRADT